VDWYTGTTATTPNIYIYVFFDADPAGGLQLSQSPYSTCQFNQNQATILQSQTQQVCVKDDFVGITVPVSLGSSTIRRGYFFMERTRDPDGTPNDDGVLIYWKAGSNESSGVSQAHFTQVLLRADADGSYGFGYRSQPSWPWGPDFSGGLIDASFVEGADVRLLPVHAQTRKRFYGPFANVLLYNSADIADGTVFAAQDPFGVTRTYKAQSWFDPVGGAPGAVPSNGRLAMRWE
jgi:hypothetical protein